MLKRVLILSSFVLIVLAMKHPLHVSVTNIEYNRNKKYIDISVKMFVDDFTAVLGMKNNRKVDFSTESSTEEKSNMIAINNYFSEHFSMEINNRKIKFVNFEFVQKKINNESVWLSFKIPYEKKINDIKINNSLLIDLYPDQTNLLIVTINGEQKGFNLNNKENSAVIKL